jgi:outer membrane protein assembly factor BamB
MTVARRCLSGVTHYRPELAYNGFTLYTPMEGEPSTTWLIDMEGRFVHRWQLPGWVRLHAELLPSGNLLFGIPDPDSPFRDLVYAGGHLVELDWEGKEVWRFSDPYMDCHDRVRMKNGNTLVQTYVEVPKSIASKVKGGIPGSELEGVMWGYTLREITPDKEVVWTWTTYEHLDPEVDALNALFSRAMWPGWNTLTELPNGDIMTCSYGTNNIYIINKKTGNIKWRWGNGIISFPHEPSMLDNGNVLVFDNGRYHVGIWPPDHSRVIEVNPETDAIEWEYRAENPVDFYSTYIGGCQRLPNGNTLVCEGAMGRLFEVTPTGQLVWEYVVPFYNISPKKTGTSASPSNATFRCHRYGPEFPGFQGKRFTPEQLEPWTLLYGPASNHGRRAMGSMKMDSLSETQRAAGESQRHVAWTESRPSVADRSGRSSVADRAQLLGY